MPGSRSLVVLALLFAACNGAENVADAPREIDFGEVLISDAAHRTVELRHAGPGTLQVKAIVPDGPLDHGFSWDFEPFTLEPNQSRNLTFTFRPSHPGGARSIIRLVLEGSFEQSRTFELVGAGIDPKCVIEPPIFGAIALGASARRDAVIHNGSERVWSVDLGRLEPGTGPFSAEYEQGAQRILPGGRLVIPVTFDAAAEGDFEARLPFLAGPCGTGIRLQATAARELVELPSVIDFGYVGVGGATRRAFAVKNPHPRELQLVAATTTLPEFELTAEVPAFIDPRGEVQLTLEFRPKEKRDHAGVLRLELADRGTTWMQSVALVGSGAGPRLEIVEDLDFESVVVGARAVRTLGFRNGGASPLRFEAVDQDGVVTPVAPAIEGDGAFAIDELRGMPAGELAAGASGELRIGFAPTRGLHEATLVIRSNDPGAPETRVRLVGGGIQVGVGACRYELDGTSLDFGEVVEKSSAVRQVVIRNVGDGMDGECRIQQAALALGSGPAFSLEGAPELTPIGPGESRTMSLRFRPPATGIFSGRLELLFAHVEQPVATVELTGAGLADPGGPAVLVAPSDLHFGTLGVGCASCSRTFTVYNVGTASLVVDRIAFAGAAPSFSVVDGPLLPVTVPAGGAMDFMMQYRPTVIGEEQAALEIRTSVSPQPYVVLVSGAGAARQPIHDVFEQGTTPKLDVLLVVDDGSTMAAKRDLLRSNLSALVESLGSIRADWQLAVTTTSVCASGCANGRVLPLAGPASARILDEDAPDPVGALEALLDEVGSHGQTVSQPLEAAYLATSGSNLTGHNAGLLRPGVDTYVYFVTDAADASPSPVSFYASHFDGLRHTGGERSVLFAAAHPLGSPEVEGCSYRTATVDHGRLSALLSTRSRSDEVEICREHWGWRFASLGNGPRDRFFLTNIPEPNAPMTVSVSGVDVPAATSAGESVWSFNASSNSIDFEPDHRPAEGAIIEVAYTPACLP